LDTGDALVGGGILGDKTQGQAVVEGMNLMGYDVLALGPKELSLGPEILRERMAEADFPMLSANVLLDTSDELFSEPYALFQIGDHTLGVIGITRSPDDGQAGFRVLGPKAALAEYVPEVAEQADTVIVLTNFSLRRGSKLAASIPGIDLLIAALPGQLPGDVSVVPETGTLVITAEQPVIRHTGRRVGRLQITVAPDGSLTDPTWHSLSMGREIIDDPEMQALLMAYDQ
jgi:2',3'-cyclic-nucleotide 2'-phosphodiesterase (5'-nucleotidase family)